MADDATTLSRIRNLSDDEDKIRSNWRRRVMAMDKAEQAVAAAEHKINRCRALYEDQRPSEPDVDWRRIGIKFDPDYYDRVLRMSHDELAERARMTNSLTFPRLTESELALEVAKVREFQLKDQMADLKSGYTVAARAVDAAYDKRWSARSSLLLAPAPDISSVLMKMEYLFGDDEIDDPVEGDEERIPEWPRRYTDAVIADLRRLNKQSKEA
jgi:hypothetical protein